MTSPLLFSQQFLLSTWHAFPAEVCLVDATHPPPVTVLRHFRAKWHLCCSHLAHFSSISVPGGMSAVSTCHSFPVFSCQVATSAIHLAQFSGIFVLGGIFAASTCHSFAAFPFQVAYPLVPPVTVSRHFRSRWHIRWSHLSQFLGISVPGGISAAPTCHSFAAFSCQVEGGCGLSISGLQDEFCGQVAGCECIFPCRDDPAMFCLVPLAQVILSDCKCHFCALSWRE